MPKYQVLVDGQFGEGWMSGDVIEMDSQAALVRLQLGHLKLVSDDEAPLMNTNSVQEETGDEQTPTEEPKRRGRPKKVSVEA